MTEVQEVIDNFTEEDGKKNFAADKGYLPKEEGFAGRLVCGYAKFPGHAKKDGTPYYYCKFKFPFQYFEVLDEEGKLKYTVRQEDEEAVEKMMETEDNWQLKQYSGCPRFNTKKEELWL